MRYLDGSELEEALKWLELASRETENSPCAKEKRGVVIVNEGEIVGRGTNAPPLSFRCEPDYCGESCRVPAVHAEMNALFNAWHNGNNVEGGIMYHAKVENGILQNSRKPRCADCSKHILQAGIAGFVLKHEEGLALYDTKEFHKISLENYRNRELH